MEQIMNNESPFPKLLGLEIVQVEPGYAKIEVVVRAEMANFYGDAHGGLVLSVADYAAGVAATTAGRYVTSQLSLSFLAPVSVGTRLVAESRLIRAGRMVAVAEVAVRTQEGREVARALITGLNTGGRKKGNHEG